jgi:hypothetical protein
MKGWNTGKHYFGFRKSLDLSDDILDPQALFNEFKNRVSADGGEILNESACLARFLFLVDNGLYDRTTFCASPVFGMKRTGDDIAVIYNLLGASGDLLSVSQGTGSPVKYDAATQSALVRITSSGGAYLKSRENMRIQKGRSYLLSGRLSDTERADNNGMTMGFHINNLPMAYLRAMITNQQAINEAWRYGSRDNAWPATNGIAVGVMDIPYADYIPSAGLYDVDIGVIGAYSSGKFANSATAASGKLADLSAYSVPLIVGGNVAPAGVQACAGSFLDAVIMHTAQEPDAILCSRLGL